MSAANIYGCSLKIRQKQVDGQMHELAFEWPMKKRKDEFERPTKKRKDDRRKNSSGGSRRNALKRKSGVERPASGRCY